MNETMNASRGGPYPKLPIAIKTAAPVEARQTLEKIKALRQDDPAEPGRLPLKTVIEIGSVFQIRGQDGRNDKHVEELFDTLMRVGDLDPITVWRCGAAAILLDGHHRLYAYRRKAKKVDQALTIPVVWFSGSTREAIERAAESNNLLKLPMTAAQRQDFAWRLVLHKLHSKAKIAKLAGVSERTVANMRQIKKQLVERGVDMPTRWREAMRLAKRQDLSEIDYEDFAEQEAQRWADRLAAEFSTTMARKPNIAARALKHYCGRQLPALVKELGEIVDGDSLWTDEEDELDAEGEF